MYSVRVSGLYSLPQRGLLVPQQRAAGKARFAATGGRVDLSAYTGEQPEQAAASWGDPAVPLRASDAAAASTDGAQAPQSGRGGVPDSSSAPMPSAGVQGFEGLSA